MQFTLKIKGVTVFCPTFRRLLASAWHFTSVWPGSGYRIWFAPSWNYERLNRFILEASRVEPINPVI